jgi:hypothetical protein
METYNLNINNKVKEANTIKQILYNNKYYPSLLNNLTPLTNNTKTDLSKPNGPHLHMSVKRQNSLLNFSNTLLLISPSKHKTL